ncbi:MAG: Ryanodine receptor Ryr [Muribaculaceae bacterium]|nr:Ryanodine receptor Ryr [Muribaculaceae bacterium]
MKKYIPTPTDTSDVRLPEELIPLIEEMAKNVHEVWAKNRLVEGWTYGSVRDDVKRQTPCMVAYEDLPENEKEYDRATSIETLKLIIKLGFDISRK